MTRENYSSCTINTRPCFPFGKLTAEEQQLLDERTSRIRYSRGELICKAGSFASHVMYVEKGLVKVFLDNGNDSLVLKIIPEGGLLGLSSVSMETPVFHYSAMAYIDTEIKQIDMSLLKQLLKQNHDFVMEVIDILSTNSVQINGRFFSLTHKQSYGRLADIILCLADRVFKSSDFELALSRKELGELSGMTPETVIRMLKQFQEEGLIRMSGKTFTVVDYDKLRRISETG
ncbi:MAG TPA: Crp/Fnr family transcriptional regulator [Bacteroidales bacterium]|nr:Crp/Fnr family transcriptional regulator [Bacteroidales bacterium]HSA44427.1 Crp/Fnr family transcriptional regulator [Bacteroidales bacterium]